MRASGGFRSYSGRLEEDRIPGVSRPSISGEIVITAQRQSLQGKVGPRASAKKADGLAATRATLGAKPGRRLPDGPAFAFRGHWTR